MIMVYLNKRPLYAPTKEDRHRTITGPTVFEADTAFLTKCRHPALVPYTALDRIPLSSEVRDRLEAEYALLMDSRPSQEANVSEEEVDLESMGYRDLQALAKEHGIKANRKREVLLEEVAHVLT